MNRFFCALLMIFSSFTAAHAQQETHGGDGFAMEFFSAYTELRAKFPGENMTLPTGQVFSVKALDDIRPKLKVVSHPLVIWDGREVSARNTPSKYFIEISQNHWQRLNFTQKVSLVLHETLPIAGWKDDDYTVSTALLKQIDLQNSKFSMRVLFDGLLTCNPAVLQYLSAGLYQSFLPETRSDLIHMAIMTGCDYYVIQALDFSSLAEVQTACDKEDEKTPFENLVGSIVISAFTDKSRFLKIFDLLYSRPEDRNLYCQLNGKLEPKGSVCEILEQYRGYNLQALKVLSSKANCR